MIGKIGFKKQYDIEVEYFSFDPKYSVKYKLRDGRWLNSLCTINNPENESRRILDMFSSGKLRLETNEDFLYFYEVFSQVKAFKIWIDKCIFIESSNPNEYKIEKRYDYCGHKMED